MISRAALVNSQPGRVRVHSSSPCDGRASRKQSPAVAPRTSTPDGIRRPPEKVGRCGGQNDSTFQRTPSGRRKLGSSMASDDFLARPRTTSDRSRRTSFRFATNLRRRSSAISFLHARNCSFVATGDRSIWSPYTLLAPGTRPAPRCAVSSPRPICRRPSTRPDPARSAAAETHTRGQFLHQRESCKTSPKRWKVGFLPDAIIIIAPSFWSIFAAGI